MLIQQLERMDAERAQNSSKGEAEYLAIFRRNEEDMRRTIEYLTTEKTQSENHMGALVEMASQKDAVIAMLQLQLSRCEATGPGRPNGSFSSHSRSGSNSSGYMGENGASGSGVREQDMYDLQQQLCELMESEGNTLYSELIDTKKLKLMIVDLREKVPYTPYPFTLYPFTLYPFITLINPIP